jgi:hypothetical protein
MFTDTDYRFQLAKERHERLVADADRRRLVHVDRPTLRSRVREFSRRRRHHAARPRLTQADSTQVLVARSVRGVSS